MIKMSNKITLIDSTGKVTVHNVESGHERYIVARLNSHGELWYWGSWSDRNEANRVAQSFENGVVIDMGEE